MEGTPVDVVFLRIPVASPANETPFIFTTVKAVDPVASPVCVALDTSPEYNEFAELSPVLVPDVLLITVSFVSVTKFLSVEFANDAVVVGKVDSDKSPLKYSNELPVVIVPCFVLIFVCKVVSDDCRSVWFDNVPVIPPHTDDTVKSPLPRSEELFIVFIFVPLIRDDCFKFILDDNERVSVGVRYDPIA